MRHVLRSLFALLLAALLVGCGTGTGTGTGTGGTAAGAGTRRAGGTASSPSGAGPVTVFAAASLTGVLTRLGTRYEQAHPAAKVTFSFAGSQTLVAQVQQGAPADLLVTADTASLARVANLLGPPVVLARNRLAIITAPGNPRQVRTLGDLARPGLRVVLAGPTVPAGRAARAALAAASVQVREVSDAPDVKAVVRTVQLGEADAGIAYVTDVRAAQGGVAGVALPGISNSYPAAVVQAAAHRQAAQQLLDYLAGSQGQAAFAEAGFMPAS